MQMKYLRDILEFVIYIAAVILITFLIVRFVAQRTEVIGGSMEPALLSGDQLIADKITYRFRDPKRFEVIVFPYREEKDTFFIKRIIGMPGEHVRIDGLGFIYIDGKRLDEDYGGDAITLPYSAADGIQLADDEYFVLGDHRAVSKDSRYPEVGCIKRSEILGRAWLRIWPFSKFGLVEHG